MASTTGWALSRTLLAAWRAWRSFRLTWARRVSASSPTRAALSLSSFSDSSINACSSLKT
ncbi:hypothetical protein PC358_12945 [Pseudomonas capeferrum]|nr:hypothetical protein PC358_12945 [Pseudomonas capeferrum]